MKPVARAVSGSPWLVVEELQPIRIGTELFTADQLKAAKVEVLQELRTRMSATNETNPLVVIDCMADELEKEQSK